MELKENKGKNVHISKMFFNIFAMEKMVKQNAFLGQEYNKRKVQEDNYGYHSNENILNELFRDYILPKSINPNTTDFSDIKKLELDEFDQDDNYKRFMEYFRLRGKVESFKEKKKDGKKKVDETTTSAVSANAQYSQPAFLGKGNKALPKKKQTQYTQGSTRIRPEEETHEYSIDNHSVVSESVSSSATSQHRQAVKQNNKNFKDDLKNHSSAIAQSLTKDNTEFNQVEPHQSDEDSLSKGQIPAHRDSEEAQEERDLVRGGIEDMNPKDAPQAWKDKNKAAMEKGGKVGEKMYADMVDKQEMDQEKGQRNSFVEKVKVVESIMSFYMDDFGKRQIVEFYAKDVQPLDESQEAHGLYHLDTVGCGNSLNESASSALAAYELHYEPKTGQVYHSPSREINETLDLDKLKKFIGYSPKKFLYGK